jgi:hypothetical protein
MFNPTDEQVAILEAYRTGGDMVVEAGAGCGKSRVLRMLAESDPHVRMQYCAFNKAIVQEATEAMPFNVTCNTVHSLAFRSAGTPFARRLNSARMPGRELARRLGVTGLKVGEKWLSDAYLASLATRGVVRFCQSADPEPGQHHIPYVDGIDEPEDGRRGMRYNRLLRNYLTPFLFKVWGDAIDTGGQLPYRHDYYVKLAQLRGMTIAADVVAIDEAQDISPVFASLVEQQKAHAQIVAAGDSSQAINGFTGAIDFLQRLEAQHHLMLGQSFRFGPEIAGLANRMLALLPTDLRLRGLASILSRIGPVDQPDAYLYRTNAGAVATLIHLMNTGVSAHLVGGAADVMSFARGAADLIDGGRTSHQELACFESWMEVQEYVKTDAMGDEIKLLVSLIDRFGPSTIMTALDRMPGEKTAKVILSTVHKSKGREFPTVKLGGDFPLDLGLMQDEEIRLMYVAVTRARLVLDKTLAGCLSEESMVSAEQVTALAA